MEHISITNDPVELWELAEPIPDFADEYDIWQTDLFAITGVLGYDYTGSIVGYVEPYKNDAYSIEYASGRYKMNAYTPKGELLQGLDVIADKYVQWVGLRRLPFVGYVYKEDNYAVKCTIWIIVPKTREQLLSTAAAFYKRRRKKDDIPNVIGLADFIEKKNSIGKVTDNNTFVPMRKRIWEGKTRPKANKKNIEEFRKTAPELTDIILVDAIKAKYGDFFIDNSEVAKEGVKETYRNELPLTLENVLQQIDYLLEDRQLLKLCTQMQHVYNPEPVDSNEGLDGTSKDEHMDNTISVDLKEVMPFVAEAKAKKGMGCLLWIILIPSSILGILFSMI